MGDGQVEITMTVSSDLHRNHSPTSTSPTEKETVSANPQQQSPHMQSPQLGFSLCGEEEGLTGVILVAKEPYTAGSSSRKIRKERRAQVGSQVLHGSHSRET